jgi:hypothetical protein
MKSAARAEHRGRPLRLDPAARHGSLTGRRLRRRWVALKVMVAVGAGRRWVVDW